MCRVCESVCASGAQRFVSEEHILDRGVCSRCGHCAGACAKSALKRYGEIVSAEQIVFIALKDVAYYEATGGGLTISGGEPFS